MYIHARTSVHLIVSPVVGLPNCLVTCGTGRWQDEHLSLVPWSLVPLKGDAFRVSTRIRSYDRQAQQELLRAVLLSSREKILQTPFLPMSSFANMQAILDAVPHKDLYLRSASRICSLLCDFGSPQWYPSDAACNNLPHMNGTDRGVRPI
ncbi:hypothetical protein P280DRAFT_13158 [Massarina eburnea CBS 473.64]|uniref:Uncharacterized protein n=1 Tax=Massarina eburnea CBS 473.64 TaxID=1395130 RepID=A0A6A6SJF6_9PLEO|nr:hypothetical protein P280DRAFT_13158 [Massarina eburnea CBS 473.64]